MIDSAWLTQLEESIPRFVQSLKIGRMAGRYLLCKRGGTVAGKEMALGWSCFAVRILYMLGRWENLAREERETWVEFIQDFQRTDGDGAFEDPPEMACLKRSPGFFARLRKLVGREHWRPDPQSILLAETKQAIATLADLGHEPRRPFRGFPLKPVRVKEWLEKLDWSKPWGAGGQSAGLVVFIRTQAPAFLPAQEVQDLLGICRDFLAGLADPATGAYFRGPVPPQGELINGAMKILMALDWLDVPIHYPEQLIATTLRQLPKPDGCHLVDAIYVLSRSLAGKPLDPAGQDFVTQVFAMVRAHANEDGGFSFYARKAQTNYYGVPVSRGLEESDLQGTCLLVWALAMMQKCADPAASRWRVFRP